jgi:predicted CXXCH cytochrome family protein
MLKKLVGLMVMTSMGLFWVGAAFADIDGSKHDFAGKSWGTHTEICKVCHAPHDNQNSAGGLLWNHDMSSGVTYTAYSSPTFSITSPGDPSGVSLLCLSCHDGTVAVDSFGGDTGVDGNKIASGDAAYVGNDLSNDHPISFIYPSATTAEQLFPTTKSVSGVGTIADMLVGGSNRVECSSCHDVHDKSGITKMLLVDNNNSALCLVCHDK